MPIRVDLNWAITQPPEAPEQATFLTWVTACAPRKNLSLGIRVVDKPEMQMLNHQYRAKNKPTNVLSFRSQVPKKIAGGWIGDLVLCWPIVCEEAVAQHKTLIAHTAHLVVHGTLHLLGYDHEISAEAAIMEAEEIAILKRLHYPNPYEDFGA